MEDSISLDALMAEGARLLEAGDKVNAHAQFIKATDADPDDEKAWLGRARSTDNVDEALHSFERALTLNPNNHEAREEMTFLQVRRWRDVTGKEMKQGEVKPRSRGRLVRRLALILLVALVVIAGAGYFVFIYDPFPSFFASGAAVMVPTLSALILPPTWTPTFTATATPTVTLTLTPAPTATPSGVIGKIKDTANIRAGPATYYATLGGLAKDDTITLVARSNDGQWYQFQNPDKNTLAWVFAELVQVTNSDANALAVATAPPYAPLPPRFVVPTSTAAAVPVLILFKLSKQVSTRSCSTWSLSGTIWNQGGESVGPGNTRPGVHIRVVANEQPYLVISGATGQNSPGYWQLDFGPANMAIGGTVMIVDAIGNAVSASYPFELTANCTNASDVNQMTIDFDSIPF